jgi:hypothetical protein
LGSIKVRNPENIPVNVISIDSFFWGTYLVDVSQLQMVMPGYIFTIKNIHYSMVNISYGTSDPSVAYIHELLDFLLVSAG